MSENETKDPKFDLVAQEEIDEVFKLVNEERKTGGRTSEHFKLMELVHVLQLRLTQQRVDAALEERRLLARFFGGAESMDVRMELQRAMGEMDRRQELKNYFHKCHREAHLVQPKAVNELMPEALEQIRREVLSAFHEFSMERVQLLHRVKELEALLPGKMLIPQGPFEVITTAGEPSFEPKKED